MPSIEMKVEDHMIP